MNIQEDSLFFTAPVLSESVAHVLTGLRPTIRSVAETIQRRSLREVILVGGGASLSAMMAGAFALTRCTTLPARALNGHDLLATAPNFKDTAVVLTSYSGETPEVLEVAKAARAAGALTVAITNTEATPLAKAADVVLAFQSKAVYVSPFCIVSLLAADVMRLRGEGLDTAKELEDGIAAFPGQVDGLRQRAKAVVDAMPSELLPSYLVVAGGPQYGVGYKLALSVIIENLWVNGTIVSTGEFYHGPIESIEQGGPGLVCLLGEDRTREAGERVAAFGTRQGAQTLVFDSRDYGTWHELLAPLPVFIATEYWVMRLAAAKGHDVDARRYMGKVASTWGTF